MVYKFLDKKSASLTDKSTSNGAVKSKIMSNQKLAEELHKAFTVKFKKNKKIHSSFINNTWGADLADMQLISKFNKGIRFLLCVIDIFSKHAWVIPLKDKKDITITNASDKSNRKPNKIWVDTGSEFCNRSMKSWLQDNGIEMYSTHNGGKSVVTERFLSEP